MKKITLILYVLFTAGLAVSAEPVVDGAVGKGDIRGEVHDAGQDLPVEYANIIVFSPADSSMVSGGISGPDGKFHLKDIPYGEYYVTVDFIGYKKKIINNVVVSRENKHIDLGIINLNMTAVQLQEAQVTADKMAVEYKLDRKVINVDQNLGAAGNTAVEALERAPSIRVDISGEVQLRGNSNFTVLIDGKPSLLDGSEALQQIPASTIESIEIITNPSVKYDPDGTAGIINIKLKKNRLDGLSGVVNSSASSTESYSADVLLNYKTGKFNIFGGVDWNDRRYPWEGRERRETYDNDTTYYKVSEGEGHWLRNGVRLKAGVDYTSDNNTTYSLGGELGDFGFGYDNYQQVREYSSPGTFNEYYIVDNQRRFSRLAYELNGNIRKQFDDDNHYINLYARYSTRDGAERQDQKEYLTDSQWNSIDPDPWLLRADESGPSENIRVELDYSRPIGANGGKLEGGYHFRNDSDDEDYMLETFDFDLGEWVVDDNYTRSTVYVRNIHAIYGIYNNSYKALEYQVGLRGEYTYRNLEVTNLGETSLVDRFDYFPSVHTSYKLTDKNQLMASYSKRIRRPRGWFLEPYETYVDENTRRRGNPDLLPEYTDSYEIGFLRTLPAGNASVEAYFRKTDNEITRLQTVDPETGILYHTFINLNNEQSLGVEGSFMYDFTKWYNLNLSGTYYNYRLDDLRGESGGEELTSNNWDVRMISSFKLPTNTRFQLNFSYESPSVEAQGREEEEYYIDFTARQDFFQRSLNVTFKVGDVFGMRKDIEHTYGDNFYVYEYRERESPVFTLSLSYKLNNFKQRERSENGNMEGGEM